MVLDWHSRFQYECIDTGKKVCVCVRVRVHAHSRISVYAINLLTLPMAKARML